MKAFFRDLQYALRALGRNRGFTVTLTLVLALGIGTTTATFAVLYGVILRPLPFGEPSRLVVVGAPAPPTGDSLTWWSQSQALESLCSYRSGGVNFTEANSPTRVPAAIVSANFFSVFEVVPQLGRSFVIDDEIGSGGRVAIISDRLWARHFGREPEAVARTITLNGMVHTIIGVMAPDFEYPGHTDVWLPRTKNETSVDLGRDTQTDFPSSLSNTMVGRLRTNVDLIKARLILQTLFERLQEAYAQSHINFGSGVQIISLQEALVGNFRPALLLLFAGVGFLLLIACTNAVNLMLARTATRKKEIAIRLCLGASSLSVVRQLVIEAVILSLAAGTIGVLLAYWGVEIIRILGPSDMPRLAGTHVDAHILEFTLCTSILVGIAIGIASGLSALSTSPVESLKKGPSKSSGGFRQRTRNIIVMVEIASAFLLVAGAGLAIKSFFRLTDVSAGFDERNVVTMAITLPSAKYAKRPQPEDIQQKGPLTGSERRSRDVMIHDRSTFASSVINGGKYRAYEFQQRLLPSIESLPGVIAASTITQLPLSSTSARKLWIDVPGTQGVLALFFIASGNYFGAMGIPLVSGRSFTVNDTENSPRVVLINQTLARLFWSERNPIGQSLVVAGESDAREIVGVVGDVKCTRLSKETEPQFYLPYFQPIAGRQPPLEMVLVIRTSTDGQPLISTLREQVALIDESLPVFHERTMEEVRSESTSAYRFRGILLGSFAVIALILAVVGVYAVVAYSVASRTREIGMRMSLGATPRNVLVMILREGAVVTLAGISVGTAAAFVLNRLMSNLLYGVSPTDPLILMWSALTLTGGALLACLLPALRASSLEPSVALRYE